MRMISIPTWTLLLLLLLLSLYMTSGRSIIYNEYAYGFNHQTTLKVMTYNIRGARSEIGDIELEGIIRQIKDMNPDIVALQEVDFRLPRSHYENQMKVLGTSLKMNYLFVPNVNFIIGSYGIGLLSKYPITDFDYQALPSGWETRGLLRAKINTGIQSIDVYTTHLGLDKNERIQQISSLTTAMSLSTSPKLLLGDFNSKPTEIPIQSLRTLYIDPVFDNKLEIVTYQNKNRNAQLDYIFHSQDFKFDSAFTEKSLISDHNPLMYSLVIGIPEQYEEAMVR